MVAELKAKTTQIRKQVRESLANIGAAILLYGRHLGDELHNKCRTTLVCPNTPWMVAVLKSIYANYL